MGEVYRVSSFNITHAQGHTGTAPPGSEPRVFVKCRSLLGTLLPSLLVSHRAAAGGYPTIGPHKQGKERLYARQKICSAYILETAKRRLLHIHSDIKVYEVLPTPTSAPHTPLTARTTQEASNMWQRPPRTTQEASKFDPSLAHSHFSRTPSTV